MRDEAVTDYANLIEQARLIAHGLDALDPPRDRTAEFIRVFADAVEALTAERDHWEQEAREWADASIENGEACDRLAAALSGVEKAVTDYANLLEQARKLASVLARESWSGRAKTVVALADAMEALTAERDYQERQASEWRERSFACLETLRTANDNADAAAAERDRLAAQLAEGATWHAYHPEANR